MSVARGEGLSDADRETILQRLGTIQEAANSRVDQKYRTALSAFSSAASSEKAALDLYLDSIELVNFKQQDKSVSDFLEWKRSNKEKLSETGFKLALQYQVRWFILVLNAASEEPDMERLASESANILDSIIAQAEDLNGHRSTLQQSVTSTVFAKAYEVNGIKVEEFPLAALQIDALYDQVLLPPLRRVDRISSLRNAWKKRIFQKGELVRLWSVKPGEHLRQGERTPEYEKFIEEDVPALRWKAELDAFEAGDERGAAVVMLKHIESNITHKSAPAWAEQFVALLTPESVEETDTEIGNDEEP